MLCCFSCSMYSCVSFYIVTENSDKIGKFSDNSANDIDKCDNVM